MSDNCLFCEIVAREVPADIVFENDSVLAFRDIEPQAPTHVLVVPKRHIANAYEVRTGDGGQLAEMVVAAQNIAQDASIDPKDDADQGGYRLVMNVGHDAKNSVPHLHMHVLGGRSLEWPPG